MIKKNYLIIGGSSDVGQCLINLLSKEKKKILATYFKKKVNIKNVNFFNLDLTSDISIDNFQKTLIQEKIKFDYIVFLNGQLHGKDIKKFNSSEILENYQINALGIIKLYKKIENLLNKNCLVLFISSISAIAGSFDPIYASSKAAGLAFFKSLSKWKAPKKKFICICPGPIMGTDMFGRFSNKRKKIHISSNPNKEILNIKDFCLILKDLLNPHWRHANGSIININGGIV